jgi:predicted O-methyltransferase YrrM
MRRTLIALAACGLFLPAALAQRPGGGPGGPPNPLLDVFDTDRDGTLSASEIENAVAALKKRDANGDGKLADDEIRPPGRGGRGPGGPGGPGADRGGAPGADLQKPSLPKDDGERRILEAIEAARQGQRYANVSTADGRLLRQLAESLGAKKIIELGTSTGESGLWFSLALRKTGGHLYTHDIDAERIAVARKNFEKAGVADLITIVEGDAHQTAPKTEGPIDIVFIDAEKPGYADYLKELLPLVRPGGLILAHNMRSPAPDPRYIEAITSSPDLDTSFLLMDGAGVGLTLKKR